MDLQILITYRQHDLKGCPFSLFRVHQYLSSMIADNLAGKT